MVSAKISLIAPDRRGRRARASQRGRAPDADLERSPSDRQNAQLCGHWACLARSITWQLRLNCVASGQRRLSLVDPVSQAVASARALFLRWPQGRWPRAPTRDKVHLSGL